MSVDMQPNDSREPAKYVSKDVSDLRIEFGKMQSTVDHLKSNTVTNVEFEKWKVEFANWKLDTLKLLIQMLLPLFAVLLGYALNSWF
ncbi:MAG: hypothetical protein OXE94_03960 [Aestuariivita sp.]|nr:hypothetical protein [Aestuariivita sp.]MCY4202584.1 hypothetical protein [Aestuariivita sp.]